MWNSGYHLHLRGDNDLPISAATRKSMITEYSKKMIEEVIKEMSDFQIEW